jgi:hypothetical protein
VSEASKPHNPYPQEILQDWAKIHLGIFAVGHWWLTPVILATQEAEVRRIEVRSQPRQIVCETLSCQKPSQK